MFSILIASTYIRINNSQEFSFFPHILANMLFPVILNSHSNKCDNISLWFWSASPWRLILLSIFSCICWSSVCYLWEKKVHIFYSVFNQIVFVMNRISLYSVDISLLLNRELKTILSYFIGWFSSFFFHVSLCCAREF